MPLIGASQYYSGFSPTLVPGCVLWLDAADSRTITTSGSAVSQWSDKSGSSNHALQTNASYRPTTSNDGGYPAISFTSSANQHMLGGPLVTSTNYSIFCVSRSRTSNALQFIFFNYRKGSGGTGQNFIQHAIGDTGNAVADFIYAETPSTVKALSNAVSVSTNRFIQSMVDSPSNTTQNFFVNGTSYTTTFTNGGIANIATDDNGYGLGCIRAPGAVLALTLNGFIYEVIAFLTELPSAQRQAVEGYLALKWGVTSNLPATHPFRSLPPFMRAFQPTDISGCAVWLDGADSTAMTFSGANIVQWLDKSGNGRHGSNVGTGNPTLGTTVTTGRRTVVMSGSNYFRLSNASTLSVTSASYFVQAYATGSNRTLLSFWNNERILGPTYYWDNATSFSLSPYAWSNTNAVLSVIENSASNCTGHFNGNALTPISYKAAVANSNVILGAHWSLDNFWLGNIQEVILYDVALTPGQRQQVETYLTNKWGTRGATPSGHYARISPALSLPFSPIFIDGCTMWLDSTDRSAITLTGSNVTGLRDKSPANLTLTGTTGFTWPNNTFNGNYPSFFNVNGGLDGVNAASCLGVSTLNLSTPFSVFTVLQKVASAPDGYVMDSGPGGSGRPYTYGSAIITPWASGGFQMSNASVLSMIWTADNLAAGYHNGTVNFTGSVSLTTGGLTIGNRFSVNESWPGHICEFVIFTGALTTVQRQRMEGYMAWRWGLVGQLPSTHPYKSFKP